MVNESKAQIKTRERVTDHGEVFTAEREVNAMLDLVKSETERIDSRFLEPACGDGNFLTEILKRKLRVVKSRYGKNPADYERYAVIAVTSIYGVDLLQDNVVECCARMFDIFDKEYTENCKEEANDETRKAVRFILSRNILCGDALTLKASDATPIIFSEWSAINGFLLKRRDFRLDEMLDGRRKQTTLLMVGWEYDKEIKAFIPLPIKEFPPIHYRRVQEYG